MAEVKLTEEIAAPAEAVWQLIRGFGDLEKWAGVEKCELEGEGVGAVRTLQMPGGITIRERLESYDEQRKSLSYSIIEPSPIPTKDYLSTMTVRPTNAESCTLEWHGRFEPAADPEQAAKLVEGIYRGGVAAIRKVLRT